MSEHVPPSEAELEKWEWELSEADYQPGTLGDNIERCVREIRRLRKLCGEASDAFGFGMIPHDWRSLTQRLRSASEGKL